jgi:BMFP domain-containing protein YqiC
MSDELRKEIETRVRTLAHSMPPSDFGSTRAIYGIVDLILAERGAEREAAAQRIAALEAALGDALNYIENTENELDIRLQCGDVARAALAKIEEKSE